MLKVGPTRPNVARNQLIYSPEIGVALTTFGGLFMLLGVMMFFDGALLALGNVSMLPSAVAPL